jgi:hypothetical protein
MLNFAKRMAQCLSLITALALVSGCAGSMPDRLREARTGAYVFHHPAPDVESTARALLEDDGFHLKPARQSGIVRTEWKPIIDDEQFATTFERYVVVIKRLSPEHCRVEAIKMSVSSLGMETAHPHGMAKNDGNPRNENTATYGKGSVPLRMGPPVARRDLDLEWKLIARKEPERARRVQSDIDWLIAHR